MPGSEQLKLNQRRIKELLQTRVEDRYILVNAAAFQLEAVEGYEVQRAIASSSASRSGRRRSFAPPFAR